MSLQPRLRVTLGGDIAIGPGKAQLLAAVGETGSISQAARRLKMSYMRAWSLVRTMNACFKQPLVRSERGGKAGGGASLTAAGKKVLGCYQRMERNCLTVVDQDWLRLKRFLRK